MKVLIVHPHFYVYGGGELLIKEYCDALDKLGVEYTILTTKMYYDAKQAFNGKDVVIPNEIFQRRKLPLQCLIDWMKEHKDEYDIINYHNHPVQLFSKHIDKPCVWQCNEPSPEAMVGKPKPVEVECAQKHIDKIVVSDAFNADRVNKVYGVEPTIICYGTNYDFFSQGDKAKGLEFTGLSENDFIVFQSGMMHENKRQHLTLQAVNALRNEIPNIKLVLAGWDKSPYAVGLHQYITDNNMKDIVKIYPHLDREVVRNIYAMANVTVQPCTAHGGWLAPFESLCTKTPVIVSTEMTSHNLISDNKFGIATNDYVSALKEINSQQVYWNNRAKKGAKWVRNNLTWDNFAKENVELFNKVLSK